MGEQILYGVYCNYNEDVEGEQLVAVHKTKEGAEKNKKAQTDYSQDYYYIDIVVCHD